jgi:urease accessory protein
VRAEVAGVLDLAPEPTVVTARAVHLAELHAQVTGAGELTATEQVLLGRMGEEPGRWTGTTRIERAGRPVLHTTVGLGPGAPAWLPPVTPRAYVSTVSIGNPRAEVEVRTGPDVVRLPLPGGWVGTAWAGELHDAVDRLASVADDPELLEVAR